MQNVSDKSRVVCTKTQISSAESAAKSAKTQTVSGDSDAPPRENRFPLSGIML
jgi:hypothetical protein